MFSRVYIRRQEADARRGELLLVSSYSGLIDGWWNNVELISQCRFRVGCEDDTCLIKSVYFKWFV